MAQAEKDLKSIKVKEERPVVTSKRKHGYQYYLQNSDGRLEYVKAIDRAMIAATVQKHYDKQLLNKIKVMHKRLDSFLRLYDFDSIQEVYKDLGEGKKALIDPILMPDEVYIEKWLETHKGGQNSFPEKEKYLTERGEYVRSKSEKILADLFYKYKIPYAYEPQFKLRSGAILCPDFVILNVRKRKTIYWEHFGLINNGEYATKALKKLEAYEKSGLRLGDSLLFSMESENMPLDVKEIEKKIKELLL
ncbi:MAG: hypothetical protein K6G10_12835 [Butyrivibrio sp.]|nr:hypothetical protein [Butyrivibrio sp.]